MDNCNCKKPCNCAGSPSVVVVQTTEGMKGLANCFVYVSGINATFYISSAHEITIISSGPVFVDNYDATTNPLGLRNQICYDFAMDVEYIFNAEGKYRIADLRGGSR